MRKTFLLIFLLVIGIAGAIGYSKYQEIFAPNVPSDLESNYLFVPSGSEMEDLNQLLKDQNFLIDSESFNWVADKMNFKTVKPGRYKIESGWSNRKLVSTLRSGNQSPVKVIINNGRLLEDVAGKAAVNIEIDSIAIYDKITDRNYLQGIGLNKETAMSLFIPNTYEFFWNTDENKFMERMIKEHQKFWSNNDREAKAEKLKLSKEEVYTLASIVERETAKSEEKPRIAGVYLNRIRRGIPLQADPTVVFALKQFDLRRVLKKHLEYDSPYNTYLYPGLPPGPISMASISSIDAVLSSEKHEFIYFCAAPAKPGYHSFAKTLAGHNANAKKYHKWLKERGIR